MDTEVNSNSSSSVLTTKKRRKSTQADTGTVSINGSSSRSSGSVAGSNSATAANASAASSKTGEVMQIQVQCMYLLYLSIVPSQEVLVLLCQYIVHMSLNRLLLILSVTLATSYYQLYMLCPYTLNRHFKPELYYT
jgi:hypothetical protein